MSILVEHVTKTYDKQPVLSDVSLDVQSGELFVLVGASGSGKSTLLRIVAGLTPLDSGRVLLHDQDVTDLPPQQRAIGFVFQQYSLFQHMNVAANVGFALDVRRVPRRDQEQRIAELLDLIGMTEYADRLPSELSGGQQQRVALARALAHEPAVLLLDEPFGALDAQIRVQLRRDLRAIQRRLKVSAILVTHDQDEAFELADRIGVIEHGKLIEVGTPDDLYRTPKERYTASFLGTANWVRVRERTGKPYLGDSPLSDAQAAGLPIMPAGDADSQDVEALLRPEAIRLAPSAEALRERGAYPLGIGIVQEIAFAVPMERVNVRWLDGSENAHPLVALVDADSLIRDGITAGSKVWLGFGAFSRQSKITDGEPATNAAS